MPPSSASSLTSIDEVDQLIERLLSTGSPLRIFGYGSIIWQPNFCFASRTVGFCCGYKRRFYQGSSNHRGTIELPGRVATLVPSEGDTVWGVAFEVVGAEAIRAAISHLMEREIRLGGYCCVPLSFRSLHSATPQEAFAFIALPDNPQYLGKASIEEQALQVAQAFGPRGSNADYVRGVANFMQDEVPDAEARDPHLFHLLQSMETVLKSTRQYFELSQIAVSLIDSS